MFGYLLLFYQDGDEGTAQCCTWIGPAFPAPMMANVAHEPLRIISSGACIGDFAVYREPLAADGDGIGMIIIKGQSVLRYMIADNQAKMISTSAINCVDAEQAEALRLVFGEKDYQH